MSKKRLTYKDFKAYFSNNLQSKDKHQFEKEMMQDAFDEEAFDGLSKLSDAELLSDLTELTSSIDSKTSITKRIIPVWFRYVAGILILLGVSLSVFLVSNNNLKDVAHQGKLSQELKVADSLMIETEKEMSQIMGNQILNEDTNQTEFVAQEIHVKKEKQDKKILEPSLQKVDATKSITRNKGEDDKSEIVEVNLEEVEEAIANDEVIVLEYKDDDVVETKPEALIKEKNDTNKGYTDAVSGETRVLNQALIQKQREEAAKKALKEQVAGVQVENSEEKTPNIRIRGNASVSSSKKAKSVAAVEKDKLVVRGKVIGADDELSIPGVSIVLKDNSIIGTTTDIDGEFELAIPSDEELKTLIASFVGMQSMEIELDGDTNLLVYMEADQLEMDEVVVVAYGVSSENEPSDPEFYNARPPKDLSLRKYKKAIIENLDFTKLNEFKGKHKIKVTLSLSYLGTLNEIRIDNTPNEIFIEEIKDAIIEMGVWSPAQKDGVNVSTSVKFTLRIKIE